MNATVRTALVAPIALSCCFAPATASAAGSPWLSEPQTGNMSVVYLRQTADEKWTGEGGTQEGPMPGGGELVQGTLWLLGDYAVRDNLAVDWQVGWASSELHADSDRGFADANFGVSWRLADELVGQPLSIAVRGGFILAGNYGTGTALPVTTPGAPPGIYALGDGASGVEASLLVGRVFAERLGVSAEFGYRRRNELPANTFYNLSALLQANDRLTLAVDYQRVNTDGDLNIGVAPFNPDRFPEVAEETTVLGARATLGLTDAASATVFYGDTIDGRNASASQIFGIAVGYAFTRF